MGREVIEWGEKGKERRERRGKSMERRGRFGRAGREGRREWRSREGEREGEEKRILVRFLSYSIVLTEHRPAHQHLKVNLMDSTLPIQEQR